MNVHVDRLHSAWTMPGSTMGFVDPTPWFLPQPRDEQVRAAAGGRYRRGQQAERALGSSPLQREGGSRTARHLSASGRAQQPGQPRAVQLPQAALGQGGGCSLRLCSLVGQHRSETVPSPGSVVTIPFPCFLSLRVNENVVRIERSSP